MPKPVGSGPAAPNIGHTSSTSDVSTTRTSSKGKKTVKQKPEDVARPIPDEKKAQAKGDRFGSGLRARAAVEMALETEGKAKAKSPADSGSSSSVSQAREVGSASTTASSTQMTPVKVNVLANTPNMNNLKQVGDSVSDRLAFFDRMCAKAHAGIPPSTLQKGEQQLNLMVAPEWLFARHSSTKDAAYTGKEMQEITEGLQAISKKYPDMLIVGGSVSWEIPDKNDKANSLMYNSSVVVQDGQIVHMYHKRAEGGETSVAPENRGVVKKTWAMSDPSIKDKIEHSNPALPSNSSIFTHKGMTFSMEICADQSGREAMKEYEKSHPDGKGTDMHILISAGMTLNPRRTPVKNGGLVVQVDGSYTASSGKGGVATVATVARPDMSIKQWSDHDLKNTGGPGFNPVATQFTSSDVRAPGVLLEPEQEQVKLFTGMTVMIPKKGE